MAQSVDITARHRSQLRTGTRRRGRQRLSIRATRSSIWLAFTSCLGAACAGPPPSKALIVRHPENACGLIMFSDCRAYARGEAAAAPAPAEDDAGTATDDRPTDSGARAPQPPLAPDTTRAPDAQPPTHAL